MASGMLHHGFQEDLRAIINKHSMDNQCNTPDFILAGMLTEHLEAYRKTVAANMKWHEPKAIGQVGQLQPPVRGSEEVIMYWASDRKLIGPPHAHLDAPCTDACYEPTDG